MALRLLIKKSVTFASVEGGQKSDYFELEAYGPKGLLDQRCIDGKEVINCQT